MVPALPRLDVARCALTLTRLLWAARLDQTAGGTAIEEASWGHLRRVGDELAAAVETYESAPGSTTLRVVHEALFAVRAAILRSDDLRLLLYVAGQVLTAEGWTPLEQRREAPMGRAGPGWLGTSAPIANSVLSVPVPRRRVRKT